MGTPTIGTAVNLPEKNLLLCLHALMTEVGGGNLDVPLRTDQPRPVDLS